jgi:hypothetical protein
VSAADHHLISSIPAADTDVWDIATGENDGRPMLIRFRPMLRDFLGHDSFPRRLTVTWIYEPDPIRAGLPNQDQADEMAAFEGHLVAALDPNRIAVLAFVFTNNGLRQWTYYSSDTDLVRELINSALEDHPDLPIRLLAEDDPEWNSLRAILKGMKSDS